MNFQDKYNAAVEKNNSLLCIGLDPVMSKFPTSIKKTPNPLFSFNKAIIDATADLVCAYKPNSAFYEALGAMGIIELKMTCDYITTTYPHIPILLDFKRGDIGSTNDGYVKYAFDYLKVDAVTVQPYLGKESLKPFLDQKDKGIFILCKTSNPGSGEIQNQQINNLQLYQFLAKKITQEWNINRNCALVVGATYPDELASVREIVKDMPILVPGIGIQGGNIAATIKSGLTDTRKGLLLSSSRSILFAGEGMYFAQKARDEAIKIQKEINLYR